MPNILMKAEQSGISDSFRCQKSGYSLSAKLLITANMQRTGKSKRKRKRKERKGKEKE